MAKRDFYEVLGVSKTATEQDIRRAYRALAMKYHPDRNKASDAEAKFKEVNEAYEVLIDPEKRSRYDQLGHRAFDQAQGGPGGFSGFSQNFSGFDFQGFGGFEEIFSSFFGGSRSQGPRKGETYELQVSISFEESLRGKTLSQKIDRIANNKRERETIEIPIPAGINHGETVVLAGKGGEGIRGGPAGDLYVRIFVHKHRHYEREGNDIHLMIPVSAFDIIAGATISIPTPWGLKSITLNTSLKSGDTERISNYGAPYKNNPSRRGDFIVHFNIYVPEISNLERRAISDVTRGVRDKTYERFLKEFN